MINLFNTHIETLSIHRVGNKSRNEAIFLSEQPFSLNDEIVPLMKEFFLKPFREKEENYYQIDIYKFYKKGLEGEEGLFNEMKENYNRLCDRAEELFIQYNNTIDKEKKEMIFENYEDYNKS